MSASSLNKIMGMGSDALFNARAGVDITGHNIANVHTEGYSRQMVETSARKPASYGGFVFGAGAEIQTIRRAHDAYMERQLGQELQNNGHYVALSSGLKNLEDIFSPELTSTIRERADDFENALREFSNYPEEIPVRVNLVDTASQLADAFNTAHGDVARVQQNITAEIEQSIGQCNAKLREVARLNVEITAAEVGSKNPANDLLDRRDKLVRELSEQMDVKAYGDKNSKIILRGPGDTLLVEGAYAAQFDLRYQDATDILPTVHLSDIGGTNWKNVNKLLEKGKLAGLVEARDGFAGRVREQLNDFARDFANEFNEVHRMGFGVGQYRESAGRDFFLVAPDNADPASTIRVSETISADPEAISGAMSPNSPGDNVLANEMIRFFREARLGGGSLTFGGAYETIVGRLGTDVQQAIDEKDASNIVLAQIKANRESVVGVSLDEEAQNMMKYQNAFNASSKLITTADEMMQTVLDLKR